MCIRTTLNVNTLNSPFTYYVKSIIALNHINITALLRGPLCVADYEKEHFLDKLKLIDLHNIIDNKPLKLTSQHNNQISLATSVI